MPQFILFFCCVFSLLNSAFADYDFEVDLGYRQDKVSWILAGVPIEYGDTIIYVPDTLSELEWKNLHIIQATLTASYVSSRHIALKFSLDAGKIVHGRNVDSDYQLSHKMAPFSISNNNAGKGYVYDASTAIGYQWSSQDHGLAITPLIGYSKHSQHLHMYDGFQNFYLFPDDTLAVPGKIEGLNSHYFIDWYGPWIGFDFSLQTRSGTCLFGGVEWHGVIYHGVGHWNLREDIDDFHHHANGRGIIGTVGINHDLGPMWSLGVIAHYRHFWTGSGVERVTIHDNEFGTFDAEFRFTGAKWSSADISASINRCF